MKMATHALSVALLAALVGCAGEAREQDEIVLDGESFAALAEGEYLTVDIRDTTRHYRVVFDDLAQLARVQVMTPTQQYVLGDKMALTTEDGSHGEVLLSSDAGYMADLQGVEHQEGDGYATAVRGTVYHCVCFRVCCYGNIRCYCSIP